MPEDDKHQPAQRVPAHIATQGERITTIHQGPLPAPEDFAAYDQVVPGAADRILAMAEAQSAHRQQLERFALKTDVVQTIVGTILGYVICSGALGVAAILALDNQPLEGLAAVVTSLSLVFAPKIYRDFIADRAKRPEDGRSSPPQP